MLNKPTTHDLTSWKILLPDWRAVLPKHRYGRPAWRILVLTNKILADNPWATMPDKFYRRTLLE